MSNPHRPGVVDFLGPGSWEGCPLLADAVAPSMQLPARCWAGTSSWAPAADLLSRPRHLGGHLAAFSFITVPVKIIASNWHANQMR